MLMLSTTQAKGEWFSLAPLPTFVDKWSGEKVSYSNKRQWSQKLEGEEVVLLGKQRRKKSKKGRK